jgi:hypothetical protein
VTPRELAAMKKFLADQEAHPAPRLKVTDNEVSLEHPRRAVGWALLMEAVGAANSDFLKGLIGQLKAAGSRVDDGRVGRHRVTTLAKTIGPHGKLTDWLYSLTKDCPRKNSPGLSDPCGVRCRDLPNVV